MATSSFALNLGAMAMYSLVAGSCAWAAQTATRDRKWAGDAVAWVGLGAFFFLLVLTRAFHLENDLESLLRHALVTDGEYRVRRDFQAPLAAGALIAIAAMSVFAARSLPNSRQRRPARLLRWARLGAVGMLGLILLRLISFHNVDALLYGAPHLNWVIDTGATILVGWAAVRYRALILREKDIPPRSRR